ncbi:hypothetical protein SCA6_018523 [Theobroma cacao]
MAPEYAINGVYSTKSDVFSFGVLVLEILSGKRNRGFCHPDHQHNLLGHAWRLFVEGKALELIASPIRETSNPCEVLRSIHVGLLCVQRSAQDRPNMSKVVLMLGTQGPLPQPTQPGFFTERDLVEPSSSSGHRKLVLSNDFTITEVDVNVMKREKSRVYEEDNDQEFFINTKTRLICLIYIKDTCKYD